MADDELAAIRAARLKELQQQSGQVGGSHILALTSSKTLEVQVVKIRLPNGRPFLYVSLTIRQQEDEARHTIVR